MNNEVRSGRYVVTAGKPIDNTPTFRVTGQGIPDYAPVDVWGADRPRCTVCSGPLSAMLTTCAHAQAVRRHLKRIAKK